MRAVRPVHIFIELYEVLRAAGWDAAARSGRQVTGEAEKLTECRQQALIGKIQRRRERILAERRPAVQAIENHLALRNHGRRDRMGQREQVVQALKRTKQVAYS